MSDPSTTANAPKEPRLCKMGCGFFGSGAFEDCCSKCWTSKQKKPELVSVPAPEAAAKTIPEAIAEEPEEPTPMDVETVAEEPVAMIQSAPAQTPKKKKKKPSYKNMMAGMLESSPERDLEQEKESLRKVTGGGVFSKIEKI